MDKNRFKLKAFIQNGLKSAQYSDLDGCPMPEEVQSPASFVGCIHQGLGPDKIVGMQNQVYGTYPMTLKSNAFLVSSKFTLFETKF